MKKIIIIFAILLLFTGCIRNDAPSLIDEPITTFEITKATETSETAETAKAAETAAADSSESTIAENNSSLSLDKKLALIDFYMVSGYYSRNVLQEDIKLTEMFAFDKKSFVRIASSDLEQEVFAYNYVSDDFTYIYYFDGEMISKTIINVGTGAVLQDNEGYAELIKVDAEEIKMYFYDLMEAAGLSPDDL